LKKILEENGEEACNNPPLRIRGSATGYRVFGKPRYYESNNPPLRIRGSATEFVALYLMTKISNNPPLRIRGSATDPFLSPVAIRV